MNIMPNFFRSLLLTSFLSFVAPILLVGGTLAGLSLIGYIPVLGIIGQSGAESIWKFLVVFGNGCPIEGLLTIGLTCAFVGAMFDTYAFYRYQTLRGN
ncbi:hypothetical protein H6S82_07985 [Planktothrix sp. FACHB-1355]|uniref:Uncharacterized protein n=1 Tax=Aerosakkonema funiforme FACHB-1375 TaxID=2949571 RepID=A0A926VIH1_9CYAN|nr:MULTISPECIES: hypothetical protein [Oscillatoriales]MBD2183723.1 hypothetical protein [Aerosakkonema funiforme FACHB-1375]MBD3558795.1 hypothetical protein [Planktothrix sp. FACHB-1355]